MLIFGYGPRPPRDLGPTAAARCPGCGNEVEFILQQQRSWVTLFFVPVFPTNTQHLLTCPICHHTVVLDRRQGHLAVGMVAATAEHRAGHLDDTRYQAQVDAFWPAMGARPDDQRRPPPEPGNVPAPRPTAERPPDPRSRRPDPEPGWYPDPFGEADERYWDGDRWTRGTKPPAP